MTYEDFRRLTTAATEFADLSDYIAEEGGSVPADIPDTHLIPLLGDIYLYAHNRTVSALRTITGLSRAAFAREYSIPIRTLENWESDTANTRTAPPYVLDLLAYAAINRERSMTMKIYYAGIVNGSMGEIMEAEYGDEWEGDVEAYLDNALDDPDLREGVPGDIAQNFGGMAATNIHTLYLDGDPHEIWFAAAI